MTLFSAESANRSGAIFPRLEAKSFNQPASDFQSAGPSLSIGRHGFATFQAIHVPLIVMEDQDGWLIGIDVKAAATVRSEDFAGIRKLAEVCGARFALGLVLYDHDTVTPFGERMFAVPISTLWGTTQAR